jgi:RHS repeat-associated protein
VTDDYSFDGWGKLTSSTGSTANSQLYKGQLLSYRNDPHAGPDTQSSMHFRNQSATTFRFTSEDPAEDDLNLYRPVGNNPVNSEDPSGLEENPGRQKLFREIIERMEGDRQRFSTVQMQRALTVLYKSAYTTPTPRAQKDIDAVSSTSAIDQYWYIVTLQSLDYQEKFAANEAAFRHYQHDRDSGSSRLLGRRMPEWAQSWDMVQGQFYKESREQLSKDVDTLLNTLDLVTFVGAVAKAELSALKLARAEARAARTIEVLPDIVSDGATSFEALSIRPGKPTQLNVDVFDLGSPVYTAETPKAIVIADGKVVVNPMVLKTEVGVWVPGMGGFDRLPGEIGRKIPRDLTDTQAQFLIESYPVEFGVSENQVTGEFRLHSGTINSIRIAPHEGFQQGDLWWLNHTHPGGGSAASTRDMAYLKFLQGEQLKAGHSAQPSSRIFPWRGESFEFTPYNPRLEK